MVYSISFIVAKMNVWHTVNRFKRGSFLNVLCVFVDCRWVLLHSYTNLSADIPVENHPLKVNLGGWILIFYNSWTMLPFPPPLFSIQLCFPIFPSPFSPSLPPLTVRKNRICRWGSICFFKWTFSCRQLIFINMY